jgi:hypothetical protein
MRQIELMSPMTLLLWMIAFFIALFDTIMVVLKYYA